MLEINLTPEQFAALGLPADGVTAESFLAALTALIEKAGGVDGLSTQLTTATGRVSELEAEIAKLTDAEKQRLADGLKAELGEYDIDEETAGVLGALTPEQRKPLLGKLPKKASAPAVEKKDPPKPVHTPGEQGGDALSEDEIADKIKARAAEIRKADSSIPLTKAYATAEAEIRNQ